MPYVQTDNGALNRIQSYIETRLKRLEARFSGGAIIDMTLTTGQSGSAVVPPGTRGAVLVRLEAPEGVCLTWGVNGGSLSAAAFPAIDASTGISVTASFWLV